MTDDLLSAEELERQRRRRLIGDARAVVDRLRDVEKHREEVSKLPPADLSRRLIPACADDAVQRWARDADERERERRAAERELRREARRDRLIRRRCEGAQPTAATPAGDAWNVWLDSHLEQERAMVLDVVGEYLGELIAKERRKREDVMRTLREEIRELRIECAKLGSESAALREELAVDRGKVVDLPTLPRRVN